MKYKVEYHGFVIVEADDELEALDKARNDEEIYEEYEWNSVEQLDCSCEE